METQPFASVKNDDCARGPVRERIAQKARAVGGRYPALYARLVAGHDVDGAAKRTDARRHFDCLTSRVCDTNGMSTCAAAECRIPRGGPSPMQFLSSKTFCTVSEKT
jgi:hypothetical protein